MTGDTAFRLWCWYYLATEEYDRSVCTGPVASDGAVLPATQEERERITRNAALSAALVHAALTRLGSSREESEKAREAAGLFRGNLERLRVYALPPYTSTRPPRR